MKFSPNPGATPNLSLPANLCVLPQEARINLVGQKTNCYLIFTPNGTWVVDPPSDEPAALAEIHSYCRGALLGILITHTHRDHTGGVAALVAQTGVEVYAHPQAQPYLGTHLPFVALIEGSQIAGCDVYELPGHRFDSLAFFSPQMGWAVVGDLVAGAGTVVLDPSDGNLIDYLESLHRLRDELRPSLLAPGHGPLISDPNTLITYYITHRLAREAQVLKALRSAPASLMTLVARVYTELETIYHPLAARSLTTHLLKLEQEDLVIEDRKGWQLKASF